MTRWVLVDEHDTVSRFRRGEPVIVQRHRTPGGRLVVRVRPYPTPTSGPTRRLRPVATRRPGGPRRVRVRWVTLAVVTGGAGGWVVYAVGVWLLHHALEVGAVAAVLVLATVAVRR